MGFQELRFLPTEKGQRKICAPPPVTPQLNGGCSSLFDSIYSPCFGSGVLWTELHLKELDRTPQSREELLKGFKFCQSLFRVQTERLRLRGRREQGRTHPHILKAHEMARPTFSRLRFSECGFSSGWWLMLILNHLENTLLGVSMEVF